MSTIVQAAGAMRDGGIVVYPTDTAYAIGCVFDEVKTVKSILRIKGRTNTKFTLICSSLYQVEKFFDLNPCQWRLAREHWPGPLSIVVSPRFAVRVPDQPEARSLARRVGKPLIATSFNKTGQPELYNLDQVEIPSEVDAVVDIGKLPRRKPSTVVECKDNQLIIHRQGSIDLHA